MGSHYVPRAAFWELQRSCPNISKPQALRRENASTPSDTLWAVPALSITPALLPVSLCPANVSKRMVNQESWCYWSPSAQATRFGGDGQMHWGCGLGVMGRSQQLGEEHRGRAHTPAPPLHMNSRKRFVLGIALRGKKHTLSVFWPTRSCSRTAPGCPSTDGTSIRG